MSSIAALIRRNPVPIYFGLVFLISWGAILVVSPSGLRLNAAEFETFGVLTYLAMIAGPAVAGVVMAGLVHGRPGLRDLAVRMWRLPPDANSYVMAVLPALVMAVTTLLLSIAIPDLRPGILDASDKGSILIAAIVPSIMVGALEEIGWTGFAVPQLRLRHSAVVTGLVVGVVWGAWHLPLFRQAASFSATIPFIVLMAQLFSWLPVLRVLMVWTHDRTTSLPLLMLMHALVSYVAIVLAPEGLTNTGLLTSILVSAVAMWLLVAAVGFMRLTGPRRGNQVLRANVGGEGFR